MIFCKYCAQIPLYSYEFRNDKILIHCICKYEHKFVTEISENTVILCGKCQKTIKGIFFFSTNKKYNLCKECKSDEDNLIIEKDSNISMIDENQKNNIVSFFNEFKNELEKIQIKNSKLILFFMSLLQFFKNLLKLNKFSDELIVNLQNILKVNWAKVMKINNNFRIIFENKEPIILFEYFYNTSFRMYYEFQNLFHIAKLTHIYEKYKIAMTDQDFLNYELFIKIHLNEKVQLIKNSYNNIDKILISLLQKVSNLQVKYEISKLKLENIVNQSFNQIESIPSIYILKRKIVKGLIDIIYLNYHSLFEKVKPNRNLLYFYKRLYSIYQSIQDKSINNSFEDKSLINNSNETIFIDESKKIKIEKVIIFLKKKLYELIQSDNELLNKSYINNCENDNNFEFSEEELNLINKKFNIIEKNQENKCIYQESNINIIKIKLILSFLYFIQDEGNNYAHIFLKKNSQLYYFQNKNKKKITNLEDYINNLFKQERISENISIDELIQLFLFELSLQERNNQIINDFELLIKNNNIQFSNIEIINLNSYIKEINTFIEEFKKLKDFFDHTFKLDKKYKEYNKADLFELGQKMERTNDNNYENLLIKRINSLYNEYLIYWNKSCEKERKIYQNIIMIKELDVKIKKLNIIINEIQNYPLQNFSFNQLLSYWKEKEEKIIHNNTMGLIKENAINELKQLNYESFKEFLISILKNNNNNIYFYQEDLDLKTNLFLYQNNINPNICRLIYNK